MAAVKTGAAKYFLSGERYDFPTFNLNFVPTSGLISQINAV